MKIQRYINFSKFLVVSLTFMAFTAISYASTPSLDGEVKACGEAFESATSGSWDDVTLHSKRCPLTLKLVQWYKYQQPSQEVEFSKIIRFMDRNPSWPNKTALRMRAEKEMPEIFENEALAKIAMRWFSKYSPISTYGATIYARLLLKYKPKQASNFIRKAWVDRNFGKKELKDFKAEFGKHIGVYDHHYRINRLLWENKAKDAKLILPWVKPDYRKLCEARVALINRAKNASAKVKTVPQKWANHPGLLYNRIKWQRQERNNKRMTQMVQNVSLSIRRKYYPHLWWRERNILARRHMEEHKFKLAYNLVKAHCHTKGMHFADAEWLAGWLALRFLNNPKAGQKHFETLYNKVSMPISRSRAAFWAGEAAHALGQKDKAKDWWQKAANHIGAYYGQMALVRLNQVDKITECFKEKPKISNADKRTFNKKEFVRVIKLLNRLGNTKLMKPFFLRLAKQTISFEQHWLLVRLAATHGTQFYQMEAAKRGIKKKIPMMREAYPVVKKEAQNPHGDVNLAFMHAIIRQESRFDHEAVSHANAIGLMQLRPPTAKEVAKKAKLPYPRLKDPASNTRLGAIYLDKRLKAFDGSMVLAIASYNAGPTPIKRWLGYFGNPHTSKFDIIDWVELIPYQETRGYVQRVLENYMIYRQMFGAKPKSLIQILGTQF